jgi:predicted TIM-barrel fold metal-dependent hydrolase
MVIDAHAYLGESIYWKRKIFEAKDLLDRMDANGIDMAVVTAPPPGPYYDEANRKVYEAVKEHPDRLIGMYRLNPWFREKELEKAKKSVIEWGFKAFKLDPQNDSYDVLSGMLDPVMELAEELEIPVYIRTTDSQFCPPESVVLRAISKPNVTVITRQTGVGRLLATRLWKKGITPMADKLENLVFGTHPLVGAHRGVNRFLKGLADVMDPRRVVFTTEVPFGYPELELKTIELTKIDENLRALIMEENIKRILRI